MAALHRAVPAAANVSKWAPIRCGSRSMSEMWFKSIFNRKTSAGAAALFDEAFLRRLERLGLQAQRTLRGHPAGGEHLSLNRLPTTIFSAHRPYRPADDHRYVSWDAQAQHQR